MPNRNFNSNHMSVREPENCISGGVITASSKSENAPLIEGIDCYGNERQVLCEQAKFYNNPWLSDIIIRVGEEKYYGHKLILVRASEVFERMLSDEWNDSTDKELTLIEEKECSFVFTKFLRYLYGCHIILSAEDALPILVLADKYNVIDLRQVAIQYAINNLIPRLQLKDLFHIWFQYSTKCYHSTLIMACISALADKMDDITSLDEWKSEWNNLDKDQMIEILKCSDLVIKDEYQLWLAVERWIYSQAQKDKMKKVGQILIEVLPFVRFPMMTADQLCDLERGSKLVEANPAHFAPHLASAYKFHALSLSARCNFFNSPLIPNINVTSSSTSPVIGNGPNQLNGSQVLPAALSNGNVSGGHYNYSLLLSPLFFNAASLPGNLAKVPPITSIQYQNGLGTNFAYPNSNLNMPTPHGSQPPANAVSTKCSSQTTDDQPSYPNGNHDDGSQVSCNATSTLANVPSAYTFLLRNYTETRWDKRVVVSNFSKLQKFAELSFWITTRSSCFPTVGWDWELKVYPKGFSPTNQDFRCVLYSNLIFDQPRSVEYLLSLVDGQRVLKSVSGRKNFSKTRYTADTEIDKRVDLSELMVDDSPFVVNDTLTLQLSLKPVE